MKYRPQHASFKELCIALGMVSASRGYEIRINEKGKRIHAIENSSGLIDVHLDIPLSIASHRAISVTKETKAIIRAFEDIDRHASKEINIFVSA